MSSNLGNGTLCNVSTRFTVVCSLLVCCDYLRCILLIIFERIIAVVVYNVGTDQRRLEVHCAGPWPVVSVAVHDRLYRRDPGNHLPGTYDLRQPTSDYGGYQLASSSTPVLCLYCLHHLCSDVLPCCGCSHTAGSDAPILIFGRWRRYFRLSRRRTEQMSSGFWLPWQTGQMMHMHILLT